MQFQIFRLKESLRAQFRATPHTNGTLVIKPKDYEQKDAVEAANSYSAWGRLKLSETPLLVGDVLVSESGRVEIFKFIGFEPAEWLVPEPKSPSTKSAAEESPVAS